MTPKQNRQVSLNVLLFTPVLIWSTVFPLSKLIMGIIPPISLVALRFVIGSMCLMGYATYAFGWQEVRRSVVRRYKTYFVLGFVGIFMNNLLQTLGLNLSTASSSSLLGTTDPIFAVFLSAVFLGEALTKRKVAGLFVAFAGVYLVTTNGHWIADWGQSTGNLLIIGSALSYSIYAMISKQVLHLEEPPIVVAWSTSVGALLLLLASLFVDSGTSWGYLTLTHKLVLAYLSVIPTSVSVIAYFYLLQRMQASQAAVTLFLIPVFSITWSVLLLGEAVTWAMLGGGVFILFGVWLTLQERSTLRQAKGS